MLPTFLVIGAAKCGTTSVCELIAGHPEAFMTDPKEPNYFAIEEDDRFVQRRTWYESLYEGAERYKARGEGSTSQTNPRRISWASRRLFETVPESRLIYMVRHPVRRIESDWKMRSHYARKNVPIARAVAEDPHYISYGLYWQNLAYYRRLFADEQILVVFLEDFRAYPERELARVFRHIGVDPDYAPGDAHQPRMAAKDFRTYGRVASALRKAPGFELARKTLPRGLVTAIKKMTTRVRRFEVAWDPEARSSVADAFRDDAAALLEHCGKPAGFWDLDA
jgi:hypothetical protein